MLSKYLLSLVVSLTTNFMQANALRPATRPASCKQMGEGDAVCETSGMQGQLLILKMSWWRQDGDLALP